MLITGDNGELGPRGLWPCKHFIMNIGLNYIELNISRNTKHFLTNFAVNIYVKRYIKNISAVGMLVNTMNV